MNYKQLTKTFLKQSDSIAKQTREELLRLQLILECTYYMAVYITDLEQKQLEALKTFEMKDLPKKKTKKHAN